jgi:hypothetical protein
MASSYQPRRHTLFGKLGHMKLALGIVPEIGQQRAATTQPGNRYRSVGGWPASTPQHP